MSDIELGANPKTLRVGYIHSPALLLTSQLNPRIGERSAIVHSLIEAFGLLNQKNLSVISPPAYSTTDKGLLLFHSSDYIKHLKKRDVSDPTSDDSDDEEFGMNGDCPPFKGLYSYVCCMTGASLEAARTITSGEYQLVINWYGGRHHGNRDKASGFCYCNDTVVCILQLLKHLPRVLYIDIDIHHGDGVEQAFYYSDKVTTLSFHRYSPGYFPGSGSIDSVGSGCGLYHTVNVPLEEGITDTQYINIFTSIVKRLSQVFQPNAVVMQCGADCLSGDPLGGFNLTPPGIGRCLQEVLQLQLPTVILGGGGYDFANTARLWAYLTSVITGCPISQDIPEHEYFHLYKPGYQLTMESGTRLNRNSHTSVTNLLDTILSNISHICID